MVQPQRLPSPDVKGAIATVAAGCMALLGLHTYFIISKAFLTPVEIAV